jgi:hypothetical protein
MADLRPEFILAHRLFQITRITGKSGRPIIAQIRSCFVYRASPRLRNGLRHVLSRAADELQPVSQGIVSWDEDAAM